MTESNAAMDAMPSPTAEQLACPEFEAVWQTIKSWDVNVPEYYEGYCGANGSHVALILNVLGIDGTQPIEPLPERGANDG